MEVPQITIDQESPITVLRYKDGPVWLLQPNGQVVVVLSENIDELIAALQTLKNYKWSDDSSSEVKHITATLGFKRPPSPTEP